MSDLEEARAAIKEYEGFIKDKGMESVSIDLALDAYSLITKIAKGDFKESDLTGYSHNLELHAAEAKLDKRIADAKQLRDIMKKVLSSAVDIALAKFIGAI